MRIFISYRRDDTAGRAGRLFDVLVARFGARNVFQDVAAIAPGTDFTKRVDDAIAQSDAALVVIGSEWLTMRGPDGTRRLDEPDDYVRREVSAALGVGVRVVPVLVGRAELPEAADLPEDLRALALRQAVTVRDDSWHQDVDALIRQLEGDDLIQAPHRRWPFVAAAAAVLGAVVLIGSIWLGRDDTGGDDSSDDVLTGCPTPDASWSTIDVAEATSVEQVDPHTYAYTVQGIAYQVEATDKTDIIVRVELLNETAAGATEDNIWYAGDTFETLLVDGISQGEPWCFSTVSGDQDLEPEERAIGLVGFNSTEDPAGARIVLETAADLDIEITAAS